MIVMRRCLYCYESLGTHKTDFHPECSREFYGDEAVPTLDFSETDLEALATQVIRSQFAVTGVQAKISLQPGRANDPHASKKLTIEGLWGTYILKPASKVYPELPEVEDLSMHLARLADIPVVPHSLCRLKSGNLAYITRRVDRNKGIALAMEDLCQLSGRLTEHKYHGSYEQVAKTIAKYSENPLIDVVGFFEQVLFCFLIGNADMHLKNFSLLYTPGHGHSLCPAYDLLSTVLVNPADKEELALTLNGKKKRLRRKDFVAAFNNLQLSPKKQENIFEKFAACRGAWEKMIAKSFLSREMNAGYLEMLDAKFRQISL